MKVQFIEDWKKKAPKLWSLRFMAGVFLLEVGQFVLQFLVDAEKDFFWKMLMHSGALVLSLAAMFSRIVLQRKLQDDRPAIQDGDV